MPDHDEIGTPAWEAAVLRRQADLCESLVPEQAAALRRRADELAGDLAEVFTMSKEEAAERIVRAISGPAEPVAYTGPPCMRCGGDLLDHILTAGPDDGPDEYRCLRDEIQDVLADMETGDPPAEANWITTVQALAEAHKRSLITHEGPIVPTAEPGAEPDGVRPVIVERRWPGSDWQVVFVGHDHEVPLGVSPEYRTQPATAEPGTTDQREATAEWLQHLDIDDTVGTDTVAVFSLLRDVADAEPVVLIQGATRCTMCTGTSTAGGPVDHRIWCPWVRVTELVGTKADA